MRWTFRLGHAFGIEVRAHALFFVFLAGIFLVTLLQAPLVDALTEVLVLVSLFGCVVLHELGHALTARAFGIRTLEIMLLPIGGVARLERIPREPLHELLIAAAGPAVSVAVSAACGAAFVLLGGSWHDLIPSLEGLGRSRPGWAGVFHHLYFLNLVFLALFNLIPAYPMDGGRVLRAWLSALFGLGRATKIALRVGQGIAVGFVVLGVFGNWILALIGILVLLAGRQEAAATLTRELLQGLPVRAAMTTRFETLATYASLEQAAAALLATPSHDFPVLGDDGRFLGILFRRDLLRELSRRGISGRVIDATQRAVRALSPDDSLVDVYDQWNASSSPTLPVLQDGQLVGLLHTEGIQNLLSVREALALSRGQDRARAAGPP